MHALNNLNPGLSVLSVQVVALTTHFFTKMHTKTTSTKLIMAQNNGIDHFGHVKWHFRVNIYSKRSICFYAHERDSKPYLTSASRLINSVPFKDSVPPFRRCA